MKRLSNAPGQSGQKSNRPFAAWLPFGLIGLGVLILMGLLVVVLSQPRAPRTDIAPARIGAPLADFSLIDLHGQQVRLSDYKGQVVLVNAWATWCPPCRAEMPYLNSYYLAHRQDGFEILAVNAGETQSLAAAFAQEYELAFQVLLDPDFRLMDGLAIHDYPTSIVIGRDGLVKSVQIGMYQAGQLEAEITPLLAR